MAKHTEHYGLNKPESSEFYDVGIGNGNLDVIDDLIKGNEDAIEEIAGAGRTTETVVGAYAAAQQAVGQVGNVDSKIGSIGDTGGSTTAGSVFAKLNAILQKFVSVWTDARAAKLDNLDGTISSRASQDSLTSVNNRVGLTGDTGATTTSGSILGKLNALLSYSLAPRVVKSVQRGIITSATAASGSSDSPFQNSITISAVVVAKSIIVFPGEGGGRGNTNMFAFVGPFFTFANSTTLVLNLPQISAPSTQYPLPWQVIEFY